MLLDPLRPLQPARPHAPKLLDPRLELLLEQAKVIEAPDTEDLYAGEPGADAVQERAARLAEVVGHGEARLDRRRLGEGSEVVLSTEVLDVRVEGREVRREEGRGELVAVAAVADEDVCESGFLDWLMNEGRGFRWGWKEVKIYRTYDGELDRAAKARGRRFVLVRPAVAGNAGEGEVLVGLGLVGGRHACEEKALVPGTNQGGKREGPHLFAFDLRAGVDWVAAGERARSRRRGGVKKKGERRLGETLL